MAKEQETLPLESTKSPLYSEDLAPIPKSKRTWDILHIAALWVGMGVCIPTYLLASYMIKTGLHWYEALIIIGLANLIITIPMLLNGHSGVKYGIPFPVVGRAAFGTKGIHIPSITRGIIACGWFGVQTWIGGLALYAIFNAITGSPAEIGLSVGKFIGFGIFWLINIFFIWRGTESIKWLEAFTAPILIIMGVVLIWWGYIKADGFFIVLDQSQQLGEKTAYITQENESDLKYLHLNPLLNKDKSSKVNEYRIVNATQNDNWKPFTEEPILIDNDEVNVQFRNTELTSTPIQSSIVTAIDLDTTEGTLSSKIWKYLLWLTAMVGFWATMAISIADITRFAKSQKDQIYGQFIGLPGTMVLYSFVGIFMTCAATINFNDVLIAEDAPWDPVSLLSKFENPLVVVIAQVFMLIATLSTNIAANVIAPSNAFSNLFPKKISFKIGGLITGIIGIVIMPWWLLNEISTILTFISGLLGPVLAILIADYFLIRKKKLHLAELYKVKGIYAFGGSGYNKYAMISLVIGVFSALVGFWVPKLNFLYSLSWFTGFIISFIVYYLLMKKNKRNVYIN